MTIMQASGLAGLGLLVWGLAGCQSTEKNSQKAAPPTQGAREIAGVHKDDLNDSPVRVVGGSITARGWSTHNNAFPYLATSVSSTSLDTLSLRGLVVPATDGQPASWVGITMNWKIEIFDINPDPNNASPNGVEVCSVSTCSTSSSIATPGQVYLQTEGNGDFYPLPAPPVLSDPGLRFRDNDSYCTSKNIMIENTSYPLDEEWCEHMGKIQVTIGQQTPLVYLCTDGACTVGIGR